MRYYHYVTDVFSFLTFEDIYNEKELNDIWKECLFLCNENKLKYDDIYKQKSRAARKEDGSLKKSNADIFLNGLYKKEFFSNYLPLVNKPLEMLDIENLIKEDNNLSFIDTKNKGKTLLSYAQDGDYYESHKDESKYTLIFWLFKEPKCFEGGDLYLNDIDFKVEIKNNMGIIIPGNITHTVEKVKMINDYTLFDGSGRFSFSTFY